MKKQTDPHIRAHLLRSAFYLLLLVAVCVIPFALGQIATTTKQSAGTTLPNSQANTGSLNTALSQSPPQYLVQDLGMLDGQSNTFALAINNSGEVTGYGGDVTTGSSSVAFIYSGGVMQSIGTLGGNTSAGNAINSTGQITGVSALPNGDSHAFRWSQNGQMEDLGTLGGTSSSGFGINDAGTVVGDALDGQHSYYQAIIYSGGVMTSLGLSPGSQSFANAINAAEQITGSMGVNFQDHAFLYSNGSSQDLGTLAGGYNSVGKGINAAGDVAGFGTVATNARHAFLYSSG